MSLFLSILGVAAGLALILGGANFLTDGAAAVARRFGLSDLIVGLTVVAFGTSAPELVISVVSSAGGNGGIALGNVVGSNIFNILMIVGVTALIRPLSVGKGMLSNDIPLVILSSAALWLCCSGRLVDGAAVNVVSRTDGILLLFFFLIFMRYTFSLASGGAAQAAEAGAAPEGGGVKPMGMPRAILYVAGGLAALVFGGEWFVSGASELARVMGVSEAVIGLTIVSAGTSLPELATSVVAAVKKRPGMAVGNVVGSSIFNAFFILGIAATIRPVSAAGFSQTDFYVLMGASVLLWAFVRWGGKLTVTRAEGAVMSLMYVAYITYLCLGS